MRATRAITGLLFLAGPSFGCDRTNGNGEAAETTGAAVADASAAPSAAQVPDAGSAAAEDASAAGREQPFQGKISMKLGSDTPATLEYAAKGDKVRVGIGEVPGSKGVNAIVDRSDRKLTLLLPDQKQYAELDLDQVERQARELAGRLTITKTGRREQIAGISCENWLITDGDTKVNSCVAQGPAYFDVGAFENATKIELPAWAERIVQEGYFPLRVTITDASGKTVTNNEVTRWTEGEVEKDAFEVPEGFTKVNPQQVEKDVKRAVDQVKQRATK